MGLSPEEKKRIYEEEKVKLEAQEKAKKELETEKTKKACLGCLGMIAVIFVIALVAGLFKSGDKTKKSTPQPKPSPTRVETNFSLAFEGDYWVIEDDNISVSKERKIPANKAQFLRNLVTVIGSGTKLEILESKGIVSPWKRVYVYNDRNEIYAEGWILAETVKRAKRTQKGAFSP